MIKLGPKEGPCGWEVRAPSMDVDQLHKVLICATLRGCNQCVRCSEFALEHMLSLTRRLDRAGMFGVERLELDVDFAEAFGL